MKLKSHCDRYSKTEVLSSHMRKFVVLALDILSNSADTFRILAISCSFCEDRLGIFFDADLALSITFLYESIISLIQSFNLRYSSVHTSSLILLSVIQTNHLAISSNHSNFKRPDMADFMAFSFCTKPSFIVSITSMTSS
ncbi:MAG: hypothetical protein ACRCXZ_09945 [Patescibacteria group bacterium]